ncbi:hypothetical protein GCM10010182_66890 [Actinomadura cremea]|nr:hypothetical protein GCM10010182_66890 [Actinomadura cremea]
MGDALHVMAGGGGVYFLTTPATGGDGGGGGDIVGTLLNDGDGWWRCRTPSGLARRLYIPRGTPNPVLRAARAATGGRIVRL